MSDWELLQQYLQRADEQAFGELVNRHLPLVYSAAVRQTSRAALAEEVAQAVFVLLARKASTFNSKVVLPAWLFRATRLIAASAQRQEARQQHQLTELMHAHAIDREESTWQELAPHLDGALAGLSEKDRQAVLLRFFCNKEFKELAGDLNISEPAAKKRVYRALDKLHNILERKGVTVSSVVLGSALVKHAAQAAPASFATAVQQAAVNSAGLGSVATLVDQGARALFWARLKDLAWVPADKILLLPAWPADWDADFKLRLSGKTIITGTVKDGTLLAWAIQPTARSLNVVICQPQPRAAAQSASPK